MRPEGYQLTYYENSNFAETIHKQIKKDYPNVSFVDEEDGKTAVFLTDQHRSFCEFYVERNCKCAPVDKKPAQWAIDKANKIADAIPQLKQRRK